MKNKPKFKYNLIQKHIIKEKMERFIKNHKKNKKKKK